MRSMNAIIAVVFILFTTFFSGCAGAGSTADSGQGADGGVVVDSGTVDDGGSGDGGAADSGCADKCPGVGTRECAGSTKYRTCEKGTDGCLDWALPKDCPNGAACKDSACEVKCTNQQCTHGGARKCLNQNETVNCGDFNEDGCLEWGDPASCDSGLVCSGGYCFSACQDECTTSGAKKCDGNYILTCQDGGAGCLMWTNPIACGTKDCSNGKCLDKCENECTTEGSKLCDGDGYRQCKDYDGDGCLEWGTTIQCAKGQTCSNGKCNDKCADECTATGARKCVSNAVAICDDYNTDGCLEWGTPTACDPLVCSSGHCKVNCTNECTVAKAKKCDEGGNVVVCDDYNTDGCLEWGSPTPCAPLACSEGVCTVQCSSACGAKGAKQCVSGTTKDYQVCDDYNDDGCLEWGSAQTCSGSLICDKGNCALSCTDECTTLNGRVCDGNSYKICGEYDGDGCLEWGTKVPCETYQTCDIANGQCKQKSIPAKVIISEVVYDPAPSTSDMFIELFGPVGTDLAGYSIVGVKGSDGSDYNAIALSGVIPAGGYFVVAHADAAQAIKDKAAMTTVKVDWNNGPDSIQVRYGALVSDALGYGSFGGKIFAGEGTAAATVAAGHALGRDKNNTDTDNNSVDFKDFANPSPAAQNLQPNVPPVADLKCPASGTAGASIQFDGSGSSDSDGVIQGYEFDWGDGSSKTTGASNKADHTFTAGGSFTVTLKVTDDQGATASDSCSISITDPKAPTLVVIKPTDNKNVTQGEAVAVLVDATPYSGRSITKVELFADGVQSGAGDTSAPYEFTYTVPAQAVTGSTINLQAKATDSSGSAGWSSTVHLKVKNDPPTASFTAIVTGALKVTMDASGSYDTETPAANLKVRWDFENDGTWDTVWSTDKVVVDHPYAEGKHTIKMEVQDAVGQTGSTTRDVTVSSIQTVFGTVTTTTWTGTIIITGDTVVPAGNTLTIAAGTSVQFTFIDTGGDGTGDYDLTINGTLKVNGTEQEPVIFTVYGTDHKHAKAWNRVILAGTNTAISNAVFEYADLALDMRDTSTLTNVTLRNSTNGAKVTSPANTTWTGVVVNGNTGDGVLLQGGIIASTGSTLRNNGGNGAYITGGTFGFTQGTVRDNGKSGLEYYGGGTGSVTKNLITQNTNEGIRITTNGSADPNPVVNYNNIFGNAKTAGRVVDDVGISVGTTNTEYTSGKTSTSWQTPGGQTLDWIYTEYSEYDYNSDVSGYAKKDSGSGTTMYSTSTAESKWTNVSSYAATKVVAYIIDYSSSSYYGSMSIQKAAYMKAGAAIEVSVITNSGTVDMRHNYFGVFPNLLSAVSIGRPAAANLQGFVGAAFDSSWSKGPYYGGEPFSAVDTVWSGTVYVTGDVTVNSGKKLTVDAATQVLFANVDQDGNGQGDYGIFVNGGTLNVNGTSTNEVLFSQYGTPKAKKAWTEVKVYGTGTSSITRAVFEYGTSGLHVESGSHTLANVTARLNGGYGFWFKSGSTVSTGSFLTAEDNDSDGIRVESYSNLALDHLTVQRNAGRGLYYTSSTTSQSLTRSSILNNTGAGAHLSGSKVNIDYSNLNYNGQGIIFEGNSSGNFTYNNVKYNKREGVYLRTLSGSNPAPVVNNNNIYGNSVTEGGRIDNPALAVSTTNTEYTSGKYSSPWSTPGGQNILHIYAQYTEYDYNSDVSGYVRKDNSSGSIMVSETAAAGPKFYDLSAYNATAMVAGIIDYSSSSYYGSMTVTGAFYYDGTGTRLTELSALTDGGKVDCKGNYWGVFPDPMPRLALGRSDAIDFQGPAMNEIPGTGP